MSTNEEIYEAQEILDAHKLAQESGVSSYSSEAELAEAGWDHCPPTPKQVARARKILGSRA